MVGTASFSEDDIPFESPDLQTPPPVTTSVGIDHTLSDPFRVQCMPFSILTVLRPNIHAFHLVNRTQPTPSHPFPPSIEMSKSATDTRKTETTTSNDDVIATAVQTQLAHISSFDRWLHQRTEVGEDRNGVVSRVQARLDRYKKWILEAEQIPDHMSDELESWSMAAHVSPSSGEGVEIVVTGPGSEESVSITTKDEKGVESLMSVCSLTLTGGVVPG